MFETKTAFVIGAGASHEYGLPVGSKLAEQISLMCDIKFDDWGREQRTGDRKLYSDFRQLFREQVGGYQEAAWAIRDGILLQKSIDDFLHINKNDEKIVHVGKASIAKAIIEAERSSSLRYDESIPHNSINIASINNTWLPSITRLIFKDCERENRENIFKNISFIVFNYDRCLEYFLYNSIRKFFRVEEAEAKRIFAQAQIIHPYGLAGALPFMNMEIQKIPFGGGNSKYYDGFNCAEAASSIRLYTEDNKEHIEKTGIDSIVENCDRIVFLGFGFHNQNLKILWPKKLNKAQDIIATSLGVSKDNLRMIKQNIASCFDGVFHPMLGERMTFESVSCGAILEDYALRLAR